MDEREWLTERFERHRSHLRAVAYLMLGSVSEADDTLQEAWLRIRGQDPARVASRDGDFDALVAVLDPDVELRIDGGVLRAEASLFLRGAEAVAGHTATYSRLYSFIRPALPNGAAGAVVAPHGQLFSVMAFTVTDGKITQIDALVDPDRLAQLDLTFPDASP